MPLEKNATALKGLKELRARIVSQERERTRHRLPNDGIEAPEAPVDPQGASVSSPPEHSTPEPSAAHAPGLDHGTCSHSPAQASPPPPDVGSGERTPDGASATGDRSRTQEPFSSAKDLPVENRPATPPPPEDLHGSETDPDRSGAGFRAGIPSPNPSATPPRWRTLLARHCEERGWSEESLLETVIETTLRARQPAIRSGSEILATADRFRSVHCPPGSRQATLQSDRGCFGLQPKPGSPRLSHWKRHYELMGHQPSDARNAAQRRTLLELLEHLRSSRDFRVGGWTKQINPDDFIVVRHPSSPLPCNDLTPN